MPHLHNEIFTLIVDLYSHPLSRSTFLHAVLSSVLLRKDQQRSLKILCESETQNAFAIFSVFIVKSCDILS